MSSRICSICGKRFETENAKKRLCSWDCKMERNRQRSRAYVRKQKLAAL